MFGLVLVSDGQNEGPLNYGSDICSACSPLVWNNLGLFHMCFAHVQSGRLRSSHRKPASQIAFNEYTDKIL